MGHLEDIEINRGMESMAVMTWTFYTSLVKEGFKEGEAFILTKTWLDAITSRVEE